MSNFNLNATYEMAGKTNKSFWVFLILWCIFIYYIYSYIHSHEKHMFHNGHLYPIKHFMFSPSLSHALSPSFPPCSFCLSISVTLSHAILIIRAERLTDLGAVGLRAVEVTASGMCHIAQWNLGP